MKHLFALIIALTVCISTYGQNLQEVIGSPVNPRV